MSKTVPRPIPEPLNVHEALLACIAERLDVLIELQEKKEVKPQRKTVTKAKEESLVVDAKEVEEIAKQVKRTRKKKE